ncbi:MAG: flagellar motor protein [Methylomonas sp.]|nr:flagellar motor protein [Methylomonas sp.]PPD21940.1 MAG: flagellar motor protein [Methylomonas sp.]PPD26082.1 MAG: flagellar motor protein [Methylomonas sp.]PPD37800.1 MAG: flagellar motor protein [Methylomonas sp.]PPD40638.1 MAG: flagellar motor protein [Methylomonas sp.]
MDILSIVGVLLGFSAIIGGNLMAGGDMGALINLHAFVIVAGGTLGATLLQFPPQVFWRSLRILRWIVVPEKLFLNKQIEKIVRWSTLARKEGLLGLENVIDSEKDGFAKKGLQLLVDGNEPGVIRDCLGVELDTREHLDMQAARVFDAMGGFAPTIGILGAVIGLIHVMQNLAKPEMLGAGIATAFVATIYGVGLANLLFIPVANKLKTHIHRASQAKEMLIEGISSIAEGENPRNIELKLSGFLLSK